MAKIVWGFPGVGKSSIADDTHIVDADSKLFEFIGVSKEELHSGINRSVAYNPEYPENYIRYVKEVNADIVLINCHIGLLQQFKEVFLVYPDITLKKEYLDRYKKRGDHESFVSHMDIEFDRMIKAIEATEYKKHKIKEKGVFLKDILEEVKNMFMTKADIVELFTKAKELFLSEEYAKTHCNILDGYQLNEIADFEELAQSFFDGTNELFNHNVFEELKTDIERTQSMIAKELASLERRGGLTHQELADKIMQGIVNGALGIRYAEIAPYSHGYEVTFGSDGPVGSTWGYRNRWECYSGFFEIGNIIAGKIEKNQQDGLVFGKKCEEFRIEEMFSAIEKREQEKVKTFIPEKNTDFERRTQNWHGSIASVMDVHAGKGLDGIVRHHYHGDWSTITPVSQNNLVETLVYMNGFCLDYLEHLDIGPNGRAEVVDYLKKHGTDISTPEKLQEWIRNNPEKCAKEENRVIRKVSLEEQIKGATIEVKDTPGAKEVSQEINR